MGTLDYPPDSNQWARDKGIKRRCSSCGRYFDPNLLDAEYKECPDCHSKRLERERQKQEQQKKRKELWDSIKWPEQKD
jgi:DNA-directed RNA polymerase subunit RPC12/RpoP